MLVLPKNEPWIEVRTANFTLRGNASESKVRDVGLELERLRSTLAVLLPSHTVNSPVPTRVFVFRNDTSMEPYRPFFGGKPATVSGYFLGNREGNDIVVTAAWNRDFRRIVYHEYLHYFLNANFPPRPVWFDEGCAEYYSTFQGSDGEARVGLPVEDHVRRLRDEGVLPLDRILAVTRSSPDYHETSRSGVFYAESWAFIHYLAREAPERSGQLDQYLSALLQGKEPAVAFRESFGSDADRLTVEVRRYVQGENFRYVTYRSPDLKAPAAAAATTLTRADVLALLGGLLADLGPERDAEAEAHFTAALAEVSGSPRASAGLGALRLRQGKPDEARALLATSTAASPDSLSLFQYGEALLACAGFSGSRPLVAEPERTSAVEYARTALRASIERDGSFAEARVLLGQTFLFGPGNVDEGIESLRRAIRDLPSRRELRRDLASLYDRKGDRAKAAEVLRTSGPDANALLERHAKETAFADSLAEVNALLSDKKDEEALARLESMRTTTAGTERALVDEALSKLREGVARNRAVRDYNEAVALANKGDTEAALKAFDALGISTANPEVAAASREIAAQLRAALAQKARKKAPAPN